MSSNESSPVRAVGAWLREEGRLMTTITPSDRPWQMPVAAALASGLPLLIGAGFDRLGDGLVASLGGFVFLYLPATPLHHRMVTIMACAFALPACYSLGLLSQFVPGAAVPALMFIAILVTMLTRFYAMGPPGGLFFIMVAALGAYTPADAGSVPALTGLVALGALLTCLIAFGYSVLTLRLKPARPAGPLPRPSFDYVVFDSVVIGVCVGLSLALAQLLRVEKAYWVPVGCLAVMQGATLRAVWTRQLHRVIGTGLGLLLAWVLLLLPLDRWSVPWLAMGLMFVVEMAVVRHYAFAAMFITPLAIMLAEAATLGQGSATALIAARFLDTVLGCAVGLAGGVCLHNPRFRAVMGGPMRRLAGMAGRP